MGVRIQPIANIDDKMNLRTLVNQVGRQLSDNTGTVTLTTGTTTVVTNRQVYAGSEIFFTAKTASAAGVAIWVSNITKGQFTITHPSGAAGRTFAYFIAGIE